MSSCRAGNIFNAVMSPFISRKKGNDEVYKFGMIICLSCFIMASLVVILDVMESGYL